MSSNKPSLPTQQAASQAQTLQLLQQQQQLQAQQMAAAATAANGHQPNAAFPPGTTPYTANIYQSLPQLMKLAQAGQLSENQLQAIMRLYGTQQPPQVQQAMAQLMQSVRAGANNSAAASSSGQASQPNMQASTSQQGQQQTQQPSQSQPAQTQSQPSQPAQTLTSTQSTAPTQLQEKAAATPPTWAGNAAAALQASTDLSSPNPGPQSWPNASGPRPTLTQGLATSSSSLGLPTLISKPADALDALGALNEGFKKDAALSSSTNDIQMRRTIKDLVASIDPNVKVDPEVEDILLHMADEFIDSVTNFSCRLAKHRGSDILDVKDLQLHLERNHNIRIPGFSSDETRLAISHSTGGAHGASKPPKRDATAMGENQGGEAGGEEKKKESKKSKAKAREAQTGGAAVRSARLAALRSTK